MNSARPAREPIRMARRLPRRAWWITIAYGGFATLWILLSDKALGWLNPDPKWLVQLSIYKGVGFVAVTSLLLLLLMWWTFGTIESGYASLKSHEAEIQALNRLYAGLIQVRQAIVSATSRDELFQRICRVLVENGGLRLAWIGWHDPETHRLHPLAHFGGDSGYLRDLVVYVDDRPEGRGPTGSAFRQGRPVVSNDSLNDPATQPWRAESRLRDIRATAALPIRLKGEVAGTLSVYAGETHYFQEQEIALLAEAAADISFALDNLAREEERRQAEALVLNERKFSDAVIESMPGILYFYDMQGRFLRWNKNFEEVSGCSHAEISRMSPLEFFAPEDRLRVETRIAETFSKGESWLEAPFRTGDGGSRPYFLTGRRVVYNGQICLAGVGIDISEQKRAEAALRELNATLESKVADRTRELQAALVRAEAADRIKSAFLASMSHELRTPLNSIIGFTGILLQGLAGPLNAEQSKQLGMVRGSARHLLELINDVLDISKIEAGQLDVRAEPFHLPESIARVSASVKVLAEKKGLTVTTRVAPELGEFVGDRRRVEQMLLNLLHNGIKFTDRGGVTLTAGIVDAPSTPGNGPVGPAVRIQVADTGIGIKSEDLAQLFQPFRQIDTGLDRQHEGTGLGLAICRRLAGLMGGEISASSVPGQGSEFTILLPFRRPTSL